MNQPFERLIVESQQKSVEEETRDLSNQEIRFLIRDALKEYQKASDGEDDKARLKAATRLAALEAALSKR